MQLVADSGSSKTDWIVVNNSGNLSITTTGLNPFFKTEEDIEKELHKGFQNQVDLNSISNIFFYGAGCSSEEKCNIVKNALKRVFPNASVKVEHDLLAAARATCGLSPGIACILGTGSNSCLFDGKKITANIPALGYILGDEGSGSYLGKRLIRSYSYGELPSDLKSKFDDTFGLTKQEILNQTYNHPFPNEYFASFATFLSANTNQPFVSELVTTAFEDFFNHHVCKYESHDSLPVHFVGSIAFYFEEILRKVGKNMNISIASIVKQPIQKLAEYHSKG